jgi:hypothetical protein
MVQEMEIVELLCPRSAQPSQRLVTEAPIGAHRTRLNHPD